MLNCFVENCAHLGCPMVQAPILDGRFSPDGLGFCVANFYGSITLYGYGERDLFANAPTEQFYLKEFVEYEIEPQSCRILAIDTFEDMHLRMKGPLCSSRRREYQPEDFDFEYVMEFDEADYYKRFCEVFC